MYSRIIYEAPPQCLRSQRPAVRNVVADGRVTQDRGRVAVEREQVVYCAEWPDVPEGRVLDLLLEPGDELKPSFDEDFYGGATLIHTQAGKISNPSVAPVPVRRIPYHLWSNRGAGETASPAAAGALFRNVLRPK